MKFERFPEMRYPARENFLLRMLVSACFLIHVDEAVFWVLLVTILENFDLHCNQVSSQVAGHNKLLQKMWFVIESSCECVL